MLRVSPALPAIRAEMIAPRYSASAVRARYGGVISTRTRVVDKPYHKAAIQSSCRVRNSLA